MSADHRDLFGKWGLIAERVAGHHDTKQAIETILGFRQEQEDLDAKAKAHHRLTLPADIAHAQRAWDDGVQHGFDLAAEALLDQTYINERREWIKEQIEEQE